MVSTLCIPVQQPAEEHGELRADHGHHRGSHQVGGREDTVDDGHAGERDQSNLAPFIYQGFYITRITFKVIETQ